MSGCEQHLVVLVDSNQRLSPVQKFSYLCSQLQGDAARTISGLPLTDDNYTESVRILRERFGQQYKLVDATTVSCPKECTPVLHYCFGQHKVSQFLSKYSCRDWHKKHPTSICHVFTTTVEPLPQTETAATAATNPTPP